MPFRFAAQAQAVQSVSSNGSCIAELVPTLKGFINQPFTLYLLFTENRK